MSARCARRSVAERQCRVAMVGSAPSRATLTLDPSETEPAA